MRLRTLVVVVGMWGWYMMLCMGHAMGVRIPQQDRGLACLLTVMRRHPRPTIKHHQRRASMARSYCLVPLCCPYETILLMRPRNVARIPTWFFGEVSGCRIMNSVFDTTTSSELSSTSVTLRCGRPGSASMCKHELGHAWAHSEPDR